MRKFATLLLTILFGWGLAAQTSMFDSLDVLLPELPDSRKYEVFQQLYRRLESFESWEKQTVAAHQFRNYAREEGDSVMLRYALTVLEELYTERGETSKAAEFSQQLKTLSSTLGYRLSEGYRRRNPVYGFRYTRLYHELKILEDPDSRLEFEIASRPEAADSFRLNDSRESGWDPDNVYWVKMDVQGDPYEEGAYLFVPESGMDAYGRFLSWDTIDVFVLYEDGGVDEQQTGTALRPADKEFRDGFNFFEVALRAGERATLFLRLKGGAAAAITDGIALQMIDPASLLEWEGLRPRELFAATHPEAGYQYTPLTHSLEWVAEPGEEWSLAEVIDRWDDQSFFNGTQPVRWEQPHWLKLRLLGSGEEAHRLLLGFPVTQSFRRIDVFLPQDRPGMYTRRTMGMRTLPKNRLVRHWNSLLPYELAADDSLDIYLRLEGYMGASTDPLLRLRYMDENSFWANWPYRMLLRGFVLGAHAILLFYFLLMFYLFRDRFFLSFGIFLLGTGLFYLFAGMNRELAFMIFPSSEAVAHILMVIGRTLLGVGFMQFGRQMLQLDKHFPKVSPWINGWLTVWLLANGLAVALEVVPSLEQMAWTAGMHPILSVIITGLAGLGFVFLFVMAGKMAGRGDTAAYFLLVAFVIILVCLVLTGAQMLWGDPLTLDHYLVYLVQAGLFCSVVFLALGAHYRRRYSV